MALKTKSVWTEIEPGDGLRILATRFRGRAMPTSRYDVWMANLGPSEPLVRAMLGGRIAFADYAREYRGELFMAGAIDERNATIKASESLLTLRISKDMFYRLVTEFPTMAVEMMRELALRVEDTNQKLREATAPKAA